MTPDKEVSVKSKVNEDKEWPIREMIAILEMFLKSAILAVILVSFNISTTETKKSD